MLVPWPDTTQPAPASPKRIVVLGATGSIGVSTLEVLAANPDRFELVGVVAHSRADQLAEQVLAFKPEVAVIVEATAATKFPRGVCNKTGTSFKSGEDAVIELVTRKDVDVVVAGIVGMAGLPSTLAALESGKTVALANKESLVVAGDLVTKAMKRGGGALLPVDSEHSAIFQALRGERHADVRSLLLTASGGPFLDVPKSQWSSITPEQAVKHPRWNMGKKISIDSATMMNKALEIIEAHWLFGIQAQLIKVVVHPQSIVHSLVDFVDGTVLAQLSQPDMKGPIAFALSFPNGRFPGTMKALDLAAVGNLEFRALDEDKFPGPSLARAAIEAGGAAPAVLNICNEWAVKEFLGGRGSFDGISRVVESGLKRFTSTTYDSLASLLKVESEVVSVLEKDGSRWFG